MRHECIPHHRSDVQTKSLNSAIIVTMCKCLLVAALLLTASLPAQTLTAAQALERIHQRYPAAVGSGTVDTVKAGDPSTPVTGIATTFMDTMDVLREASRRGENLVITHEPSFYNHRDDTAFFTNDPVYQEKLTFIQQHHMVVFRLHDAIHQEHPDPFPSRLIQILGWQTYIQPGDPIFATIPRTTLSALALELKTKLSIRTLRIVGDPNLSITRVALRVGAPGSQRQIETLNHEGVEVLLTGEASEWETVEYVRDAAAQGRHKALIVLGHEVSEEPGMIQCADDLKLVFPTLKVEHIPANQPLWNPEHPPAH